VPPHNAALALELRELLSISTQLFGEVADGLAVHDRPVPLVHDLEIRRALAERRARLPAVHLQEVGGRGEHVRHAAAQVDAAVAVEINAVLDVGRRQELGLADLARIGAEHIAQRQVAALRDLQRRNELALEQLAAPAIVRERRQRAHHRQLAHVAAVVGLHGPDRHDDGARHAELSLDPLEQSGMARHQRPGALDARLGDARACVFLEALAKGVALAPIEGHHRRIVRDAGERACDDLLRDAGGRRLARHRGDEGIEIPAALRGAGGPRRGKNDGAERGGEGAPDHDS
jgi:hypothetical protein